MSALKKYTNYVILSKICVANKLTGVGDYSFEMPDDSVLYMSFQCLLFLGYYFVTFLEGLEFLLNSYPNDLHNDSMSLAIAHVAVISRFHTLQYKKDNIRKLNDEMSFDNRDDFIENDAKVYEEQYKKLNASILLQVFIVVSAMFFYLFEGVRRYFETSQMVIFVGYWPFYGDVSVSMQIVRIAVYIIVAALMASMISADTLAVSHLIMLSYKFVILRRYFSGLHDYFADKTVTSLEMRRKCLDGINKHQKLLSMTDCVYNCFGVMMSIQVCQGCIVVVMILLKVALSDDLPFFGMMMSLLFTMGVLTQLALYQWNAGEITYQASLLSSAIFHCGWHLRSVQEAGARDVRRLVLVGCAQAQRPLVMKAFGLQDMSYQGFLTVVRATYSLFAVMY